MSSSTVTDNKQSKQRRKAVTVMNKCQHVCLQSLLQIFGNQAESNKREIKLEQTRLLKRFYNIFGNKLLSERLEHLEMGLAKFPRVNQEKELIEVEKPTDTITQKLMEDQGSHYPWETEEGRLFLLRRGSSLNSPYGTPSFYPRPLNKRKKSKAQLLPTEVVNAWEHHNIQRLKCRENFHSKSSMGLSQRSEAELKKTLIREKSQHDQLYLRNVINKLREGVETQYNPLYAETNLYKVTARPHTSIGFTSRRSAEVTCCRTKSASGLKRMTPIQDSNTPIRKSALRADYKSHSAAGSASQLSVRFLSD